MDIPLPSQSLMEYIHLEMRFYFMRNILKISAQAKRDYTFQYIYLLLRCLHLLDVVYRDWHIMSVLKIPSARSLKHLSLLLLF